MCKRNLGNEQGSAMVMIVISLLILIGFTGLVIDGGRLYLTKSRLQNAADAAALAGAEDLPAGGTAANTAISYAHKNDMEPSWSNVSNSGNTYTASNSGDIVKVDIIPASTGTSTEPAYTSDELNQMRSEFTNQLGTAVDAELIAYADQYGISVDITTIPAHTEAQIAAKRTELSAILNNMSDADLIAQAQANSVTTGLGQSPTAAEIDAQIVALNTSLTNMTDPQIMDYATQHGINIDTFKQNKNKLKNRSGAITFITDTTRTQLQQNAVTVVSDKSALVAALLDIQVNAFASETVDTINNRPSLITAVVDAMIADYADDTVEVTTGHPDRIRVTCTRSVQNTFMAVLGFQSQTVSATAVAENSGFTGDTLPFINWDPYEEGGEYVLWDSEGSGNKESLDHPSHVPIYHFDPEVGAVHGNGKMANIKSELEPICTPGAVVYVISLLNDEMVEGNEIPTTKKNGKSDSFVYSGGNVGQGTTIGSEYLALLKCTIIYYDDKTVGFRVDDIYEDLTPAGLEDIPGKPKLVE